jgi:hypothetical protein
VAQQSGVGFLILDPGVYCEAIHWSQYFAGEVCGVLGRGYGHTRFALLVYESSVNNVVGADFAPQFNVPGSAELSPSQPLGYTAALHRRELQLGVRLSF